MKKRSIFITLLLAVGFCLSSCVTPHTKKENGIHFDSIQLERISHFYDKEEYPYCELHLNFVYPSSGDAAMLDSIQRFFTSAFLGDDLMNLPPKEAIEQFADEYVQEYRSMESDFEEENLDNDIYKVQYMFTKEASTTILFNQDGLLSVAFDSDDYTGGAHGFHGTGYTVMDVATCHILQEEEIFVDNYREALTKIIVDQLMKDNEVTEPSQLEDVGFFSVEDIAPNGNFYIDEKGIVYLYNQYEVAPYALGQISVRLSFEQIELLLREGTPVADLCKYYK